MGQVLVLFLFFPSLNVVNYFRHASIQIGDKAFYTVKPCDVTESSKAPIGSRSQEGQKEDRQQVDSSSSLQDGQAGATASGSATSLDSRAEKVTETTVSKLCVSKIAS